jgi:hypothetical protein
VLTVVLPLMLPLALPEEVLPLTLTLPLALPVELLGRLLRLLLLPMPVLPAVWLAVAATVKLAVLPEPEDVDLGLDVKNEPRTASSSSCARATIDAPAMSATARNGTNNLRRIFETLLNSFRLMMDDNMVADRLFVE